MLAPLFDVDVSNVMYPDAFVKEKVKVFSPTLHLFPSSQVT
jgi:hypothetical protein